MSFKNIPHLRTSLDFQNGGMRLFRYLWYSVFGRVTRDIINRSESDKIRALAKFQSHNFATAKVVQMQ